MQLEIHPARDGSVDSVMELVNACIVAMRSQGIEQWDEVYPDRQTFSSDLAAGELYTAVLDGQLAGIFVLNAHQDPEYAEVSWTLPGTVAVVHRLMVHPNAQQRGVAAKLMEFAENRAVALSRQVIRLDAFSKNPGALRLYEKIGYRLAGTVTFRKGLFHCYEKALQR